jgi:hypothetical protein
VLQLAQLGELGRQGLAQALLQLEDEWEATSCAVCAGRKWKNFPFCRRCSILAQRAHLMRGILRDVAGYPVPSVMCRGEFLLAWAAAYDVARDYLFCRHAGKVECCDE